MNALILKVLDHLALFTDLGERVDADGKMHVGPVAVDTGVALAGLNSFGRKGFIRNKQQRAAGDLVFVANDENGRRFHIDADRRVLLQLLAKFHVVFPHAAVRRVDDAGSIIESTFDQLLGNELMEFEGRQSRHERRQVIVGSTFTADGTNRQDKVADFRGVFEPTAFAEKEHGLGMVSREQIHDRGGVRRPDAEIDDRQAGVVGGGLHRAVITINVAGKPCGKPLDVVAEIRQQYKVAKAIQRHAGVPREPVSSDFDFGEHLGRGAGSVETGAAYSRQLVSVGGHAESTSYQRILVRRICFNTLFASD